MGIAVSGVIFPPIADFDVSILNRAFELKLEKIEGQRYPMINPRFDPRNKGDFIVHRGDKHTCIMNTDVADHLLFKSDLASYGLLSSAFPTIEKMIFFCLYDSGGSYGYSAFEHGELLRRKLYTLHGGHVENGTPLPVEEKWQPANLTDQEIVDHGVEDGDERRFFRHVTSGVLADDTMVNSYLVDELLRAEYGWSPLDDGHPTECEYYRTAESGPSVVPFERERSLERQHMSSSIKRLLRSWFR